MKILKRLLTLWGDRHKQKTTALGLLLAFLAGVGLPADQMAIAVDIVSRIGIPAEYSESAVQVVMGVVGAVFVFLDGKRFAQPPAADGGGVARLPVLTLVAAVLLLTLGACAGAVPWNKQNYAGIQYIQVKTGQACQVLEVSVKGDCTVTVIDGKENGSIDIKTVQADGTTTNIKATDAKAFDGQAQRADVEKAVSKDATGLAEKVVEEAAKLKNVPVPKALEKDSPE